MPTFKAIMAAATREGLIETLVEAGVFISSPSYDYCFGRIDTMSDRQLAVSTGRLNTARLMGSVNFYICNAAVVATSALKGRIADPWPYLAEALTGLWWPQHEPEQPASPGGLGLRESDYDTDLIVGVHNIKITDMKELATLAMFDYTQGFAATNRPYDLLVGGENFGYGHLHYPAMRTMRHLGIWQLSLNPSRPAFFAVR